MLFFVGGLSGAGKSDLGKHLKEHCGLQWIELDRGPGVNAVEERGIGQQWTAFISGDPGPLIASYPGDTVVTVASFPIIRPPLYLNSDKVTIRYLTGPKEKCFFRARERSPNLVDRAHWCRNNRDLLTFLNSGSCPPEWIISVFDESGIPLTREAIACALIRPTPPRI
jgi:hypothetical protein